MEMTSEEGATLFFFQNDQPRAAHAVYDMLSNVCVFYV